MGKIGHSEILGIENVEELLDSLTGYEIVKHAEKGLKKTMIRMKEDAKRNAPRDTGELYKSIDFKTGLSKDGYLRGELVAASEHAIFVEMGTGPEGERGLAAADVSPQIRQQVTYNATGWFTRMGEDGKSVKSEGMAPRPYLYPAFKAHQKDVKRDVMSALQEAISAKRR